MTTFAAIANELLESRVFAWGIIVPARSETSFYDKSDVRMSFHDKPSGAETPVFALAVQNSCVPHRSIDAVRMRTPETWLLLSNAWRVYMRSNSALLFGQIL